MWLFLGILVAVGTSAQEILKKRALQKMNLYLVVWGWWFFALPFFWAAVLFQGFAVNNSVFWIVLTADTFVVSTAVIFYVKALEASDLSLSVPMLSFTPALLLITSFVLLGEKPTLTGIIGILLIVAGSYVLNFKDREKGLLAPFKSLLDHAGPRYMLVVAVMFSIGGNLDKLGVIYANQATWLAMLTSTLSVVLTAVMFIKVPAPLPAIMKHWKALTVLGGVLALTYIIQLIAIMMTIVPYLIAVKRLSILCSALYGFVLLKEVGLRKRLPGIIFMLAGVFLIAFS